MFSNKTPPNSVVNKFHKHLTTQHVLTVLTTTTQTTHQTQPSKMHFPSLQRHLTSFPSQPRSNTTPFSTKLFKQLIKHSRKSTSSSTISAFTTLCGLVIGLSFRSIAASTRTNPILSANSFENLQNNSLFPSSTPSASQPISSDSLTLWDPLLKREERMQKIYSQHSDEELMEKMLASRRTEDEKKAEQEQLSLNLDKDLNSVRDNIRPSTPEERFKQHFLLERIREGKTAEQAKLEFEGYRQDREREWLRKHGIESDLESYLKEQAYTELDHIRQPMLPSELSTLFPSEFNPMITSPEQKEFIEKMFQDLEVNLEGLSMEDRRKALARKPVGISQFPAQTFEEDFFDYDVDSLKELTAWVDKNPDKPIPKKWQQSKELLTLVGIKDEERKSGENFQLAIDDLRQSTLNVLESGVFEADDLGYFSKFHSWEYYFIPDPQLAFEPKLPPKKAFIDMLNKPVDSLQQQDLELVSIGLQYFDKWVQILQSRPELLDIVEEVQIENKISKEVDQEITHNRRIFEQLHLHLDDLNQDLNLDEKIFDTFLNNIKSLVAPNKDIEEFKKLQLLDKSRTLKLKLDDDLLDYHSIAKVLKDFQNNVAKIHLHKLQLQNVSIERDADGKLPAAIQEELKQILNKNEQFQAIVQKRELKRHKITILQREIADTIRTEATHRKLSGSFIEEEISKQKEELLQMLDYSRFDKRLKERFDPDYIHDLDQDLEDLVYEPVFAHGQGISLSQLTFQANQYISQEEDLEDNPNLPLIRRIVNEHKRDQKLNEFTEKREAHLEEEARKTTLSLPGATSLRIYLSLDDEQAQILSNITSSKSETSFTLQNAEIDLQRVYNPQNNKYVYYVKSGEDREKYEAWAKTIEKKRQRMNELKQFQRAREYQTNKKLLQVEIDKAKAHQAEEVEKQRTNLINTLQDSGYSKRRIEEIVDRYEFDSPIPYELSDSYRRYQLSDGQSPLIEEETDPRALLLIEQELRDLEDLFLPVGQRRYRDYLQLMQTPTDQMTRDQLVMLKLSVDLFSKTIPQSNNQFAQTYPNHAFFREHHSPLDIQVPSPPTERFHWPPIIEEFGFSLTQDQHYERLTLPWNPFKAMQGYNHLSGKEEFEIFALPGPSHAHFPQPLPYLSYNKQAPASANLLTPRTAMTTFGFVHFGPFMMGEPQPGIPGLDDNPELTQNQITHFEFNPKVPPRPWDDINIRLKWIKKFQAKKLQMANEIDFTKEIQLESNPWDYDDLLISIHNNSTGDQIPTTTELIMAKLNQPIPPSPIFEEDDPSTHEAKDRDITSTVEPTIYQDREFSIPASSLTRQPDPDDPNDWWVQGLDEGALMSVLNAYSQSTLNSDNTVGLVRDSQFQMLTYNLLDTSSPYFVVTSLEYVNRLPENTFVDFMSTAGEVDVQTIHPDNISGLFPQPGQDDVSFIQDPSPAKQSRLSAVVDSMWRGFEQGVKQRSIDENLYMWSAEEQYTQIPLTPEYDPNVNLEHKFALTQAMLFCGSLSTPVACLTQHYHVQEPFHMLPENTRSIVTATTISDMIPFYTNQRTQQRMVHYVAPFLHEVLSSSYEEANQKSQEDSSSKSEKQTAKQRIHDAYKQYKLSVWPSRLEEESDNPYMKLPKDTFKEYVNERQLNKPLKLQYPGGEEFINPIFTQDQNLYQEKLEYDEFQKKVRLDRYQENENAQRQQNKLLSLGAQSKSKEFFHPTDIKLESVEEIIQRRRQERFNHIQQKKQQLQQEQKNLPDSELSTHTETEYEETVASQPHLVEFYAEIRRNAKRGYNSSHQLLKPGTRFFAKMEEYLIRDYKLDIDLSFLEPEQRRLPKHRYAHLTQTELPLQMMDDATLLYEKYILCSPDHLLEEHELVVKQNLVDIYQNLEQHDSIEQDHFDRQWKRYQKHRQNLLAPMGLDNSDQDNDQNNVSAFENDTDPLMKIDKIQTEHEAPQTGWAGSIWGWITGGTNTTTSSSHITLQSSTTTNTEQLTPSSYADDVQLFDPSNFNSAFFIDDSDIILPGEFEELDQEIDTSPKFISQPILIQEEVFALKPRILKPNRPSKYLPPLPFTPYSTVDLEKLDPIEMARQRRLHWFTRHQQGRNNEYFDPLDLDADDIDDYDGVPIDPLVIEAHRLDPLLGLTLKPGAAHVLREGAIPLSLTQQRKDQIVVRQLEKIKLQEIQLLQEDAFNKLPPTAWGVFNQELLRRHYYQQRDDLYDLVEDKTFSY